MLSESQQGHVQVGACEDAIREERQKHQRELSALRAHYETELGQLRNECEPCVNGAAETNEGDPALYGTSSARACAVRVVRGSL